MSDETLIRVEGVSKKFCRSLKKSLWYGMQDLGNEIRGRRHGGNGVLRPDEFWAVQDVSFELKRGECLGLLGRNGAGKTTLLRMLNGLIKPDAGRIEMRGRIGAMIALGAGFKPILTGRENIYVNAAVLGLAKHEVDKLIDEIIAFAEIDEFIDMPVQSYSSGMSVRLGFAVASTLVPDILILDEVLAVGDVGFRTKCFNRIYDLAGRTAVILVSHSMPNVARIATRASVMSAGQTVFSGEVSKAIDIYESAFSSCEAQALRLLPGVTLGHVHINGSEGEREIEFESGAALIVSVGLQFPPHFEKLEVLLNFYTPDGALISQVSSDQCGTQLFLSRKQSALITIEIPALTLGSGKKMLSIYIRDDATNTILVHFHAGWVINVLNGRYLPAPVYHRAHFRIE
jgi:lipopolysaccharide transport system ATP-binding protein